MRDSRRTNGSRMGRRYRDMGFAHDQQVGLLGGVMFAHTPPGNGFRGRRGGGREASWSAAIGVAAVLFLGSRAAADEALPVETLTHLKAATVFVKVESGKDAATGSGFVIRTEGQTVHVVTNNHVLDLTPEGRPRPGVLNPA